MSIDFTEFSQGYSQRVDEERRRRQQERMKEVAATGQKIAELVADPKWATYVHQVEEHRNNVRDKQKSEEQRLLGGPLSQENYVAAKYLQAYFSGRADGLDFALQVAKDLIEKGEEAAKKIG